MIGYRLMIDVVRQLDEHVWREYVENHPHGNIFHTPEMFRVFARAKGYRSDLWAAVDGSGCPLALLLPVQITTIGGPWRRLTTRAIANGSVLCSSGPEGEQALGALLQTYKREMKNSVILTELRNMADLSHLQPVLQQSGFEYEDHLDYFIDLDRTPEAVFQGIGSRTRKNLRHAMNRGEVVIEEASRPEQVAACYELLRKTYATAHVPLADRSLFEALFDELYPHGMVKFMLARIGDVYAAGSVELVYKDVIYGWYGGMDRQYSNRIPNELLLWHLFRWGAENGFKVYDFGGAGRPDEKYGVRDFKSKFGGQLVCFGRNTYVHAPIFMQVVRRAYSVYRRFV